MTRFLIRKDPYFSPRYLTLSSQIPAVFGGSGSKARIRFFWARNAIYHSLVALSIPRGSKVLVPAYLCKAAVQPVEAFGAESVFYSVHSNCAPDLTDLESKIDRDTRVVMAVHHFGLPRGIRELREICNRHGLLLLEDCAHVLQVGTVEEPLGTIGDASVFSWRKFLPLYDGGELLLNRSIQPAVGITWQRESALFTLRACKNLLEEMLPQEPPEGQTGPETVSQDDSLQPEPPRGQKSSLRVDRNYPEFLKEHLNFPMSRISRLLLGHFLLGQVAAKRRENYLYLRARLSDVDGVRCLDERLPEGIVPWVLPVFVGESPNAHKDLREIGIPAVSWGGVRPYQFAPAEFPNAEFLYEHLIFLPIHQDLEERHMELVAEAVKRVRRSKQSRVPVAIQP